MSSSFHPTVAYQELDEAIALAGRPLRVTFAGQGTHWLQIARWQRWTHQVPKDENAESDAHPKGKARRYDVVMVPEGCDLEHDGRKDRRDPCDEPRDPDSDPSIGPTSGATFMARATGSNDSAWWRKEVAQASDKQKRIPESCGVVVMGQFPGAEGRG